MKCWCGNDKMVYHRPFPGYSQCSACGTFISTDPPLDYDFLTYWHDRQRKGGMPEIEQRAVEDFHNRIPWWWSVIKDVKPQSVLEIGCGHGGFLNYCMNHDVSRCVGIEISKQTCDFARKRFDTEVICGSFPEIAQTEIKERFDVVCAFDVLEHVADPLGFLTAMGNLGGHVVIQTPMYCGEKDFPHFHPGEHQFIFNDHSLPALFDKAGIKIQYVVRGAFQYDVTIIGAKP